MKKWYYILLISVLIVVVIGQVAKHNSPDNPFAALHVQEDALGKGFGVSYLMDGEFMDSFTTYPDQLDDIENVSTIIAICKPTGRIFQQGDFFGQEVTIDTIIKGDDEIEMNGKPESFYAFSADGFRKHDDGKTRYLGGCGLMQKDSSYLLFLQSSPNISLIPVRGYELYGGFFGYLKLNVADNKKSKPMTKPVEELSYDEVWQYEYIAESQEVLDVVYEIKERIMSLVL